MNKKFSISILFGFFLLVGLFGLTKIATGELDTDVAVTKVEIYGEANDNISSSQGGVEESVNFTVGASSTTGVNITNITIDLGTAGAN